MKFNIKLLKKYKYPTAISAAFLTVLFIFQNGSCARSSSTTTGNPIITQAVSADQSLTPTPTATPSEVNATPTPIATSTPDSNVYNLPDAPSYTATINGLGGPTPTWTSPNIVQGNTYRVKVVPLIAPPINLPGYSDWTFPYGCVTLTVTANGVSKTSTVLRVPGISQPAGSVCANAPTFQVFDFSVSSFSGFGGFLQTPVTISNATYDNCRETNPMIFGCAMSPTFQNHVVSASITIQTQGTWMDTPPCASAAPSCPAPASGCSIGPAPTDTNGCVTGCGTQQCQAPPIACPEFKCALPQAGCTIGPAQLDKNGCSTGCGPITCQPITCAPIACPELQIGCIYDTTALVAKDRNGCQTSCRPITCPSPIRFRPIAE